MDLKKYKNDGWGLSQLALEKLISLIREHEIKRVIEFGSGTSTRFLSDLNDELPYNIDVTSFDNDEKYAYKPKENDCVNLIMRPLVECDNNSYELMFENKIYNPSQMKLKTSPLTTRQENNFYDIQENDIIDNYDLMILDGPNGNGRNFSFMHMKNHLKSGAFILIDDSTHYDFVKKAFSFFDCDIIFEHEEGLGRGKDNIVILKVK